MVPKFFMVGKSYIMAETQTEAESIASALKLRGKAGEAKQRPVAGTKIAYNAPGGKAAYRTWLATAEEKAALNTLLEAEHKKKREIARKAREQKAAGTPQTEAEPTAGDE